MSFRWNDIGQTYDVVLSDSGEITPVHVVGSNIMLIPVAFGPINATALPGGDTALIEQPSRKGQSARTRT